MSFIREMIRIVKTLRCYFLQDCYITPPNFGTTTPNPNGPRTSPRPQVSESKYIWSGNKTIADCEALNAEPFYQWCSAARPNTSDKDLPDDLSGDMICNHVDPKCVIRLMYDLKRLFLNDTSTWNLDTKRKCEEYDDIIYGKIKMDVTKRKQFYDKCDTYEPSPLPLYTMLLIGLSGFAALMIIGVFVWRWKKSEDVFVGGTSEAGQMSRLTSSGVSNVPTQRSLMPSRSAFRTQGASRATAISGGPSASGRQPSFNRLSLVSARQPSSSRLRSGASSRSHSRSASSGRKKRF